VDDQRVGPDSHQFVKQDEDEQVFDERDANCATDTDREGGVAPRSIRTFSAAK